MKEEKFEDEIFKKLEQASISFFLFFFNDNERRR